MVSGHKFFSHPRGGTDKSRLYRWIAGLDQRGMPLCGGSPTNEQISTIKAWIDQGATWDADRPEAWRNRDYVGRSYNQDKVTARALG